jgi:NAD-dependent SIR2 family protein deacetylase
MSGHCSQECSRAAALIARADALVIGAGAGMGVDSGLPDFRGTEGFWRAYPALGSAGLRFDEIASPAAFRREPVIAWGFYGHRLMLYRRTVPHEGFAMLRCWATRLAQGAAVFTSNVDGQFHKAGFDPQLIYECHGSIHYLQCLVPCSDAIWEADGFAPDVDASACALRGPAPTCPRCGALARPNVLMFGDREWVDTRSVGQAHRLRSWLEAVMRPVVIELGAGTAIPSVRHFSERVVRDLGGRLVRINPRDSEVDDPRDVGLAMGALEGLRAIGEAMR